ncbi:unnamed protein product [Colias eurytheme]|nr:unnamed protein product [Colias eurytheme]
METSKKADDAPVHYDFTCTGCGLIEKAHYKGTNPPFSRNIELKYSSYIMKDPFSPPGKGEIMVIGADCATCDKAVCIGKECSIFYCKSYCLQCAKASIDNFPAEIKSKIVQLCK